MIKKIQIVSVKNLESMMVMAFGIIRLKNFTEHMLLEQLEPAVKITLEFKA